MTTGASLGGFSAGHLSPLLGPKTVESVISAARQRTAQPARPEAQPLHQCHHRCPRARRSKWFHANRRPAPELSSLWAGASRTSTAAPTRARQHARRVQMGAPLRQVACAGDLSRARSLCAAGSMPFSNMVGWGSRADHAPRGGRRALRAAGCLGGGLAPRARPAPRPWERKAAQERAWRITGARDPVLQAARAFSDAADARFRVVVARYL